MTCMKLVTVELVKPRAATTIKGWLDRCIADRSEELKPESIRKLNQTRDKLLASFDASRSLRSIDADEAGSWR